MRVLLTLLAVLCCVPMAGAHKGSPGHTHEPNDPLDKPVALLSSDSLVAPTLKRRGAPDLMEKINPVSVPVDTEPDFAAEEPEEPVVARARRLRAVSAVLFAILAGVALIVLPDFLRAAGDETH